jgi:hypothetical protein
MTGAEKIQKAFWEIADQPDGTERKYKITHGVRQDMVRKANGTVRYELWGHVIASYTPSTGILSLSDEGYRTVTTKDRLNGILHYAPKKLGTGKIGNFGVWQERRVWHLNYRNWSRPNAQGVKFKWNNGAQIDINDPFRLLEKLDEKELAKRIKTFNGHIKRFVDAIKKRVFDGSLSCDGGECWLVKGVFGEGQGCDTCESLLKPGCGGGATLIAKALQEKGYRFPGVWMAEIGEKGEGRPSITAMQKNWKHPISGALRDYVRKRITKMEFQRRQADA